MPHKKKAGELTTEETMKRLFPKPVRETLKNVAHENDEKQPKTPRKSNDSKG